MRSCPRTGRYAAGARPAGQPQLQPQPDARPRGRSGRERPCRARSAVLSAAWIRAAALVLAVLLVFVVLDYVFRLPRAVRAVNLALCVWGLVEPVLHGAAGGALPAQPGRGRDAI